MHIVDAYFLFLIGICVLAVVVTIVVQYLHFRSESKPFTEIPIWVRRDFCVAIFSTVRRPTNFFIMSSSFCDDTRR